MIDLPRIHAEYQRELDNAVLQVIHSGQYIGGPAVASFEQSCSTFLAAPIAGVGNGTDALQIALMALGIGPGDEVIVPAFTYASSAEVIGVLGARAVWCDVLSDTFCIDPSSAAKKRTSNTKAVIAVHLYGQCADIESLELAIPGLPIVEDTAQAFGATFLAGKYAGKYAGTVGAFGTFSFFPTKSLGALGDGGALSSPDKSLLAMARSIAKHGQSKKYTHDILGINSRLDPLQAAALNVKLGYFKRSVARKLALAKTYHQAFSAIEEVEVPVTPHHTSHVYHQYTIKVPPAHRDPLRAFLQREGIATMVYYPIPLNRQQAYTQFDANAEVPVSEALANSVISLPIDELLRDAQMEYITTTIASYFSSL